MQLENTYDPVLAAVGGTVPPRPRRAEIAALWEVWDSAQESARHGGDEAELLAIIADVSAS